MTVCFRSPMTCVDNSFSSDISVPNFRILNSSPASSIDQQRSIKRAIATKTNLKQVTTAQSVLVDLDSSTLTADEPPLKRVHFNVEQDSENKMTRNL